MKYDTSSPTLPTPSRRRSVLKLLAFLLLLAAALNGMIEYGERKQICANCSADSVVKDLRLHDIRIEWGREIEFGRLAAFINENDEQPCAHVWDTWSSNLGNVLYRHIDMEGARLHTMLSFMNSTRVDLDEMHRNDPEFLGRLKHAIKYPTSPASEPIVQMLMQDLLDSLAREIKKDKDRER